MPLPVWPTSCMTRRMWNTTLARIVESAIAVVGCDYAGVLMIRKGNQVDAIYRKPPGRRESRQTAGRVP